MRKIRALVVDEDASLRQALALALCQCGACVDEAASPAEGVTLFDQGKQSLIVVDTGRGDGAGARFAQRVCQVRPTPIVLAMSATADGCEGFRLAELGVRAFLPKPLCLTDFLVTLERALTQTPNLEPLLATTVGCQSLHEVQQRVRRTMLRQALALAHGNKTRAAAMLGISRQAIQQLIREFEKLDKEPS